jgi:hypothetical protein
LNAPESFWLILCLPRKTFAPTGVETVKLEVDSDLKTGLTLMRTLMSANTKVPLFLVAKGLAHRCYNQFGDVADQSDIYTTHPRSGSVTQLVSVNIWRIFGANTRWTSVRRCGQHPMQIAPKSEEAAHRGIRVLKVPKEQHESGNRPKGGSMGRYKQRITRNEPGPLGNPKYRWPQRCLQRDLQKNAEMWFCQPDNLMKLWGDQNDYRGNNDDDALIDIEYEYDNLRRVI